MKDLKNSLTTSGKGSTNIQSKRIRGFGYQVLGFGGGAQKPAFVAATGGTPCSGAICGDYKIHTFTGPGTFCVSCAGNSAGSNKVSYLVAAGGGGGGSWGGGGGGAGGYREGKASSDCYTASPLNAPVGLSVAATSYPITVGGGGANAPSFPARCNRTAGSNSVFSSITSAGGGKGGANSTPACQADGGSGGGRYIVYCMGSGNIPPVSPPQGNPGGIGAGPPNYLGGGGGGAGAVGGGAIWTPQPPGTPKATCAGVGGDGVVSYITGSPVTRGGGGGGGGNSGDGSGESASKAAGGAGGGGAGGVFSCTTGIAGTANTGGGGGSAGATSPTGNTAGTSGGGGSGIVIIRYKFQ